MIRVGVGGWTFPPWRGVFYPPKLPHAHELHYASRALAAIEVNGTFYGSQKPETFRKWASETPDGFVFSLKALRFAVNRKVLAEAGESMARFANSGIAELGPKPGPILWEFAGTKRFEADEFAAFLKLLPKHAAGLPLRHVPEPRHASFDAPAFRSMACDARAAVVFADSEDYPNLGAEPTADFTYARLQRSTDIATGYEPAVLDDWAATAREWARPRGQIERDVFIFFISGEKARNPAAAMGLIERLS